MLFTISEALRKAVSFLHSCEIDLPRLDAEVLLAFILQKDRIYLYLYENEELPPEIWIIYEALIKRRGAGEPLAYLTKEKEFMGFSFSMAEGVLIPRPETEHLVEAVITWIKLKYPGSEEAASPSSEIHILDLGTGCGNISLSLLLNLPAVQVTGIDREEKAVALTRHNAVALGAEKRLNLQCGRYWDDLEDPGERKYNVIVSNPPYIPTSELPFLQAEVLREPLSALDGGEDGLQAYREIFSKTHLYLASPGLLALEIGLGQADAVLSLAENCTDFFHQTEIQQDYAGIDRVLLLEH